LIKDETDFEKLFNLFQGIWSLENLGSLKDEDLELKEAISRAIEDPSKFVIKP
jgi:hypothetical protein